MVLQGGPWIYSSPVELRLLDGYIGSEGFAPDPSLNKYRASVYFHWYISVGRCLVVATHRVVMVPLHAQLVGGGSTSLTGTFPIFIYCWWVFKIILTRPFFLVPLLFMLILYYWAPVDHVTLILLSTRCSHCCICYFLILQGPVPWNSLLLRP